MLHHAESNVTYEDAKVVAEILAAGSILPTSEDVIFVKTVEFENGCFADIKCCNGDPPYIDPVLFDEHGCEIAVGDADAMRIDGTFQWSCGDDEYVAIITVK